MELCSGLVRFLLMKLGLNMVLWEPVCNRHVASSRRRDPSLYNELRIIEICKGMVRCEGGLCGSSEKVNKFFGCKWQMLVF